MKQRQQSDKNCHLQSDKNCIQILSLLESTTYKLASDKKCNFFNKVKQKNT